MNNRISATALALTLLLACSAGARDYLYAPTPAEPPAPSADGVLVREVTVKKGDTLYRLSRQFSGKGGYYPQILLFNDLKNPNLIYPGDLLRIPVSRREASQGAPRPQTTAATKERHQKKAAPAPSQLSEMEPAVTVPSRQKAKERVASSSKPAAAPAASTERTRYTRIEEALRKGDCRAALPLLDSFIAEYPSSSLTPDATLSRAECYLKISAP